MAIDTGGTSSSCGNGLQGAIMIEGQGKTRSVQNLSLRNRQQMFRKGGIMVDVKFMLDVVVKQRQFKSQDHWNRKLLEAHQQRMVHILRRHAYENSPFYQHFHTGLYDASLDQLPVLTKAHMMDQFDRLVTDRAVHLEDIKRYMQDQERSHYFLGRYVINATSGSSGHPAVVLLARASGLRRWLPPSRAPRYHSVSSIKGNLRRLPRRPPSICRHREEYPPRTYSCQRCCWPRLSP